MRRPDGRGRWDHADLNLEFSNGRQDRLCDVRLCRCHRVARFWSAAVGRPLDPQASARFACIGIAGRRDTVGCGPSGRDDNPTWMFAKVPEPKVAKNRMHPDLMAPDPEAEVTRLVELGGIRIAEREEYGYTWTVMADPDGNEFCVARAR
jgi:hypothetical protein